MNRKIVWLILIVFIPVLIVGIGCSKGDHSGHGSHSDTMESKQLWHCPMHPTYTSDQKGECGICGMDLVPVEQDEEPSGPTQWTCPMHPEFVSTNPDDRCSICNMKLVPVEKEDHKEHGGMTMEDQATVKIPERRQQLIGVKTGLVEKKPFIKTVRTVGRVAFDPELYRAQEEYLGALEAYQSMKGSSIPEAVERAKSLLDSSELRLRLLGLSDRQIQLLSRRKGPDTSLLITRGGSDRLWLYADVYAFELPLIKVGQEVEATTISYPGEVFKGKVRSIDPNINPKTRSARVRAEIENREGMLKPDMYLNAQIKVNLGERLTVPEPAVMDTGVRRIVFVTEGDGFFEPREVLLGDKSEAGYQVKSGLVENERVVTSGNFLIDSESKLKAALSAMAGGHQH